MAFAERQLQGVRGLGVHAVAAQVDVLRHRRAGVAQLVGDLTAGEPCFAEDRRGRLPKTCEVTQAKPSLPRASRRARRVLLGSRNPPSASGKTGRSSFVPGGQATFEHAHGEGRQKKRPLPRAGLCTATAVRWMAGLGVSRWPCDPRTIPPVGMRWRFSASVLSVLGLVPVVVVGVRCVDVSFCACERAKTSIGNGFLAAGAEGAVAAVSVSMVLRIRPNSLTPTVVEVISTFPVSRSTSDQSTAQASLSARRSRREPNEFRKIQPDRFGIAFQSPEPGFPFDCRQRPDPLSHSPPCARLHESDSRSRHRAGRPVP